MGQQGFDMQKLSMGTKGLLITGAVLLISLFLPWQSVFGFSVSGIQGLGVLVLLLVLGLIAWEIAQAVTTINVGDVSPALISAGIGGLTAVLTILLFLTRLAAVAFGAFLGLIAALGMGYAAWLRFNESKTGATPPPAPPAA